VFGGGARLGERGWGADAHAAEAALRVVCGYFSVATRKTSRAARSQLATTNALAGRMNVNNPAVKRIMGELRELTKGARPDDFFVAAPMEDNLFEWHFSIRGPAGTAFDGGVYHGKIMLPAEYPFKPPSITLLTPNGRFEVGKKICLSVSAHHPEHWQPAWGIRTIITALIAFMPTKADGALAGLDYTDEERRALAARSHAWHCPSCGAKMSEAMLCPPASASSSSASAAPAPPPAVPAELRFSDEPTASAGAPSGGASAPVATTQTAEAAPHTAEQQPEQPDASGLGRAHEPAEGPVEPVAPVTPPPPRPQQPPLQPQEQQRQQPEAAGVPSLVWALALAILALLVRKLLRFADSA